MKKEKRQHNDYTVRIYGVIATGRLKTREWKTWHQMTGVENAGVSDSDQ